MKRALWLLLLVATLGLAATGWIYQNVHQPYRGYSNSLVLTLEPGESAPRIGRRLVERGVLRRELPFLALHAMGRFRHRTLKAGEYLFDRPATPLDVYEKIAQGKVYYHLVVIPEGSDRFDMARILEQKLGLDPEEFLRVTRQTAAILARVAIQPELTRTDLSHGLSPASVARLDATLRPGGSLVDGIARVKIWSRDGMVVYADDHQAIGFLGDVEFD